jgi:LysM repeat protein
MPVLLDRTKNFLFSSQESERSSARLLILGILASLAVSACTTASKSRPTQSEVVSLVASPAVEKPQSRSSVVPVISKSTQKIRIRGVDLENTEFDFPITVNSKVEQWVDYFAGRGRGHFERYLERSELFIPFIQPILRQNGMPEDLVYLAMIESGFNNHAASHAKAVGPWQFISATGKRYGLSINWWEDERRDTHKSTVAAIDYLKDLYGMFGSWELAAAGYNAGEAKIARAIQRYGTKDFWSLTRQRYLRLETRDYVPKIMAAAIVAKNRVQFGFPPAGAVPTAIAVDPMVSLPKKGETLESVLRDPEDEEVSGPPEPTPKELTPEFESQGTSSNRLAAGTVPSVSKKGELSGIQAVEVDIQGPADLQKIAQAAGVSYGEIKSLNPELLRWTTPPYRETYRIRIPATSRKTFVENYQRKDFERLVEWQRVRAKAGDSLSRIARNFGVRVDPLVDLNRMGATTPLKAGTTVLLPLPNDRSRSIASLEVRDPPARKRIKRGGSKRAPKISAKRRESARADIAIQERGT